MNLISQKRSEKDTAKEMIGSKRVSPRHIGPGVGPALQFDDIAIAQHVDVTWVDRCKLHAF